MRQRTGKIYIAAYLLIYKSMLIHRFMLALSSCRLLLARMPQLIGTKLSNNQDDEEVPTLMYTCIVLGLSCFAGVCSGLTVGFMSISKQEMMRWSHSGDPAKAKPAKVILQFLNNHRLLLATLLLANAFALEALPIFLDKLVPAQLTILLSTLAVLILGEVIPQACCTGSHKVAIAYFFCPFVRTMQTLLYVIVKPISYILDKWLGHEEDKLILTGQNLKVVLHLHNKTELGFRPEEIKILQNTLDLRNTKVSQAMIRLENIFCLSEDTLIDLSLVNILERDNFSKIPVYRNNPTNITGFVKAKNLLKCSPASGQTLRAADLIHPIPVFLQPDQNLLEAIEALKDSRNTFAIVRNNQTDGESLEGSRNVGMITLKKLFQNLVLDEFRDEDHQTKYTWVPNNKSLDNLDEAVEAKEQA